MRDDLSGQTFGGRYNLRQVLARGGMGTVYLATDLRLWERELAVKVLDDDSTRMDSRVARFLAEAKAIASLEHPSIIQPLDFGTTPEGHTYLVMERLRGEDLRALLAREGRLPWARVREIGQQLCAAMTPVHEAGYVHRDLKPENIFLVRGAPGEDRIKILDFGIAWLRDMAHPAGDAAQERFGTPEYMSPESLESAVADPRVDIYAIGVILYECLTGRLPFSGTDNAADRARRAPLPEIDDIDGDPRLLPAIQAVIEQAVHGEPRRRFATSHALGEALQQVNRAGVPTPYAARKRTRRVPQRRSSPLRSRLALSGAALGLGVLAVVLASIAPPRSETPAATAVTPQSADEPRTPPTVGIPVARDAPPPTPSKADKSPGAPTEPVPPPAGPTAGDLVTRVPSVKAQIVARLRRLETSSRACGEAHGSLDTDRAQVTLRFSAEQGLVEAKVSPSYYESDEVWACLQEALRKQAFPRVKGDDLEIQHLFPFGGG